MGVIIKPVPTVSATTNKFVITLTDTSAGSKESIQYVNLDSAEGYYWTGWIGSAKFFNSAEECATALKSSDFTRNLEYANHTSPPRMIYSGLNLCDKKQNGSGVIQVCEVSLRAISSIAITASVNLPLARVRRLTKAEAREWVRYTGDVFIVVSPVKGKYFFADHEDYISRHMVGTTDPEKIWSLSKFKLPLVIGDVRIDTVDHLLSVYFADMELCESIVA